MTLSFKLICKRCLAGRSLADVTTIFTESLILAQDERWRRA